MDTLNLRPNHIFLLDRWALRLRVQGAGFASDIGLAGSTILPIYVLANLPTADRKDGLVMLLESHLFSQGLTNLCKGIFRRPRPFAYNASISTTIRTRQDASRSFFSGHTAAAFDNAVVAGLLFNKFHPRSDQRRWIWISGCTLAASTGILRVISGNHFPTDVLAGAAAGCLAGYFIHFLNH